MKTIERENICIRDWIQEPEQGCVVSPLVNGGTVIEAGKAPLNLTGLDLGLGTTVVRMYRCPIGDAYDRLEQIAKMLSDPGSQKRFLRAYKELSAMLDAEFISPFTPAQKKLIKRETGCIIGNGSFLKISTDDKERYPYLLLFSGSPALSKIISDGSRYQTASDQLHDFEMAQKYARRSRKLCLLRLGKSFYNTDVLDDAFFHYTDYPYHTIETVFLTEKLPYALYSGTQFFNRAEVKDSLSYLRMIAYQDDLDFLRISNRPKRNLGKRRIAFLQEYAAREGCSLWQALLDNLEEPRFKGTKARQFASLIQFFAADYAQRPVSEVLGTILDQSGYEEMLRTEGSQERLDNLAELKQSVYEYETTCGEETSLEDYLTHVALFTNGEDGDGPADKVKLMTVHAAKGLEFPYVFLCGMNEGIFPSRKVRTRPGMEEERRLAFVAMTRAEKGLYLSEAGGRNHDSSIRYPSRFLLDIDQSLLTYTSEPQEGLIREARDYIELAEKYLPEEDEAELLRPGQRVKHAAFGMGTILEVDGDKGACVVRFDGMETPRQISFRAKLEKVDDGCIP